MSNAEVSAEYCRRAFVARNLAMSAPVAQTQRPICSNLNNFGFPKLAGTSPRTVVRG